MSRRGSLIADAIRNEVKPPYPPFQDAELGLLEAVLRLTWIEAQSAIAKKKHEVDFDVAKEEEISYAIAYTLGMLIANDTAEIVPFLSVFQFDAPEPKLENFNRSTINKKCDFSFSRRNPQPGTRLHHNALFAEAKLVTDTNTMGYYVSTGVRRFLKGDYAWSMPQAMLLGYVRNTTQTLPDALTQHFNRGAGKKAVELALEEGPKAFRFSRKKTRMHWTRHDRQLAPRMGVTNFGAITIFHLWLDVE